MKVRLIAKTIGYKDTEYENKSLDEITVGIARLSSSREINELFDEPDKLLRHCILNGHWSVFTTTNLVFEIETSRAVARQLLRHWSLKPQELCLSGDSEIYFDLPGKLIKGKKHLYKLTLRNLYNKWNKNKHLKNRIKNMKVRILDEDENKLTNSSITDIIFTGTKEVFEIELENGKKIKTTKEHKFFIKDKGWLDLETAIGLEVTKNNTATFRTKAEFATNGIPCYQDFEWLKKAKQESIFNKKGVRYIAEKANVSYHTIRKWLKRNNLQFSKKEIASVHEIWNKGKSGYTTGKRSKETRQLLSSKARKGKDSNLWRGGVERTEREKISDWLNKIRLDKLAEFSYKCKECSNTNNLHLHHIIPVSLDITKAYDLENIEVLCANCHIEHHKKEGHYFGWNTKKRNPYNIPVYSKIKYIKYIGLEDTYDLTINHKSHNYVANGIVVHNSQRYAEIVSFEEVELRKQCKNNRQSSEEVFNPNIIINDIVSEVTLSANELVENTLTNNQFIYERLLDAGCSRETSRLLLPECATTKIIFNGTLREWITTLNQRLHKTAQKETRLVCEAIRDYFIIECPIISKCLFNFEDAYEIHLLDRLVLEKFNVFNLIKNNNYKKLSN